MVSRTVRKPKNQKKERDSDGLEYDRLSNLPDSILSHIISFLDTKTALKTSILSRRYNLVWASTPCLDFRFGGSQELYGSPDFYSDRDQRLVSFESYVNGVLRRREHIDLTMFRLSVHQTIPAEFLLNCLDYAVQHNVKHLRIRAYLQRNHVALPRLLLNSTSLISLRLNNAVIHSMELPKSVVLPNLKILQLKNFEFSSANYNGELFLGCRNLENLVLSKCRIKSKDRLKILDVNCLKLKNLEIRHWRSHWECFDEHMINVNAPILVSFTVQGFIARLNFKGGSSCLENACIHISYPTQCSVHNPDEGRQKTSENLMSMLRQIRNVKFLSFSWKAIEEQWQLYLGYNNHVRVEWYLSGAVTDVPYFCSIWILSYVPALRTSVASTFENLRLIKVTAEDKCMEITLPVEAVLKLVKKNKSDNILVFDVFEILKLWRKCTKVKPKCSEVERVEIQLNVVRFLLESSPSAEFLSIQVPKASSD